MAKLYEVTPLGDLLSRQSRPGDKQRAICAITFDDGWVDTFQYAFPLLQKHRVPATVFLAVRFIDGKRRFWQDRLVDCLREIQRNPEQRSRLDDAMRFFPWCPLQPQRALGFDLLRQFLLTRRSQEAEDFVSFLESAMALATDGGSRSFMNWDEVRAMSRAGVRLVATHSITFDLRARRPHLRKGR